MDIAALLVNSKLTQVPHSAAIAILKKTMDAASQSAQSELKLIERTTQPQLGANLDVKG